MFMNLASGVTLFRDLGNTLLYSVYSIHQSFSFNRVWTVEPGVVMKVGVSHFVLHVENLGGLLLVRKFGTVFRS